MQITPTPSGEMRYRMTIIQTAPGPLNELNETQPVQTAVGTVWCKITPIAGTELFVNAQNTSDVTHEIRCRYSPKIKFNSTLQYNGRTFDIVGQPLDLEEQHIELQILAHEQRI